jgi:peptidoglycan hydrolase-like protein with peptidoglycan-binding domain
MNRTLAASLALATLGLAGMAHAQSTTPNAQLTPSVQPPSSMTAPPASTAPASPSTVRQAQQQLKAQGLYQGPIDGVLSTDTKTAISKFQQKNGLVQTAMLDQQTIDHLIPPGSGSTMQPAPAPNTR